MKDLFMVAMLVAVVIWVPITKDLLTFAYEGVESLAIEISATQKAAVTTSAVTVSAVTDSSAGRSSDTTTKYPTTEAVIPAVRTVADPTLGTTECGATYLPIGRLNQTVRCDGRSWVSASNLLNDGTNVETTGTFRSGPMYASAVGTYGIQASSDIKAGVLGSSQSGWGVWGTSNNIGVYGQSWGEAALKGTYYGQNPDGAAVKAIVDNESGIGYGIYQTGPNSKNYFQGRVDIGVENSDDGYRLEVDSMSPTKGAIYGKVIGAQDNQEMFVPAVSGYSDGKNTGVTGSNAHTGTGVSGFSNYGVGVNAWSYAGKALNIDTNTSGAFGIYEEGNGESLNYLDGNTGIGVEPTVGSQKLEVNGGIRMNPITTKPACTAAQRGTLWFTQGGTNVSDFLEICIKNSNNAYFWKSITNF